MGMRRHRAAVGVGVVPPACPCAVSHVVLPFGPGAGTASETGSQMVKMRQLASAARRRLVRKLERNSRETDETSRRRRPAARPPCTA